MSDELNEWMKRFNARSRELGVGTDETDQQLAAEVSEQLANGLTEAQVIDSLRSGLEFTEGMTPEEFALGNEFVDGASFEAEKPAMG